MQNPHTNSLINETSPYLLQHAHNPVNWNAWNTETLERAKSENKLIIISVGYAACHWCHVMEHESFEDEDVAEIMNANFISIKVDREERPDIDQVYMNAVQLMTGQGGWPLNVIALPDGRPVWGGTYFKKDQWTQALTQIAKLYANSPEKLYDYADKLEQGIKNLDVIVPNTEVIDFQSKDIENAVDSWSEHFDLKFGGVKTQQKFMMPNNYHFLLRYAYQKKDIELQKFVNTTLTKIAYGGVYDHIGGGFSRYSVDSKWHVPHFEKMLYDNGQLVSLYADAYLITKDPLYKEVITETLDFVARELTTPNGAFYSSLDADSNTSEGVLEEGAYYVWTKRELETLLKSDYKLFAEYYNINAFGFWEHKNYVLIRSESDQDFTTNHKLSQHGLNTKKQEWKTLLLKERAKRETPRLDDKSLTSWNALMLKGYLDAYRVLGDKTYLDAALKNAYFIVNNQLKKDGSLYHSYKNDTSSINGFLEDYATTIEAFILAYEITLDKQWLYTARDLTNYAFDHFYDAASKMFFFTNNNDARLVSRSIDYRDNVIPASNSIFAKNLFKLSHFLGNAYYLKTATTMLHNVSPEITEYPSGFSNWLDLMLNYTEPYYEVAIAGKDAKEKLKELNTTYIPNKLIVGSTTACNLPLLEHRFIDGETLIYVCVNKSCKLPVSNVNAAIQLIKE
ncbi:thioredoxin domain-containing protein [Bizionia gelidisalsuginis]|uniref:Thioredoxin domain-containing protein n=1 Tax=Bizionia gelidisalsuginis TaxID=291188 RepID=A0ABY3M8U7_9FLAO|nr:thioredoxin domain-containing protein [Bizionia gelidisalsuginis]TYC10687.1 thioredoxin domain-containing protein [Bizionia gelidisalsuginis]